jgi:Zn-dependent peptidase ImmA (M78 family)
VVQILGLSKKINDNSTHAPVRQRFTIAHEIGHYAMHVKKSMDSPLFIDRLVAFRDDESSAGSDWEEVEANTFAVALLMLARLVREEIEKGKMDMDDEVDPHKTIPYQYERYVLPPG